MSKSTFSQFIATLLAVVAISSISTTVSAASLWFTDAPEIILPEDSIDLKLTYVADTNNDLVVTVFDQNNGWSWVNGQEYKQAVQAGSSFQRFSIPVSGLTAGRDYKIKAELRPQGGNYSSTLIESWWDVRVSNNKINFVEVDTTIAPDYPVSYIVDYEVEASMDLVIGFYDQNYGWVFGEEYRYKVEEGRDRIYKHFRFGDLGGLTPGASYKLKAELRPTGASYQEATEVVWQDISVLNTNEVVFDNDYKDYVDTTFSNEGRSVYYNSAQEAELSVVLLDPSNWSWVSPEITEVVPAGNGNRFLYDFSGANLQPGKKYVWKAQLRPVGGNDSNAYSTNYLDVKVLEDSVHYLRKMPEQILSDAVFSVSATASLSVNRDIVFLLFNPEDYSYASAPVTRTSFRGRGVYTAQFDARGLTPGATYLWKVELRPIGGGWQDTISEQWAPVTVLQDQVAISSAPQSVKKGDDFVLEVASDVTADRELSVYIGDTSKPRSFGDLLRETRTLETGLSTKRFSVPTGGIAAGTKITYILTVRDQPAGPGSVQLNRIEGSFTVTD